MPTNGSKSDITFGFITVCSHEPQGLFGGFLVLNHVGRPVEFHCTAPVRPNRAQEILYGPTLKPYLYGEQIGGALLARAKAKPSLIFTDEEPVLAARGLGKLPVVLVAGPEDGTTPADDSGSESRFRLDQAHLAPPKPRSDRLRYFQIADQTLALSPSYADDEERVNRLWTPYADDFDLAEPFGRIRDAIDEARKSASR